MIRELLSDPDVLRGLVFALYGVGFWIAGVIIANYLYERYTRDD